jgi:hypothetical protein
MEENVQDVAPEEEIMRLVGLLLSSRYDQSEPESAPTIVVASCGGTSQIEISAAHDEGFQRVKLTGKPIDWNDIHHPISIDDEQVLYHESPFLTFKHLQEAFRTHVRDAISQADQLLHQQKIRDYLCPRLESATDDVKEVIKVVSAAALGAHLGVPVDVLVLAAMTLIITKAGIKGYCAQDKDKEKAAASAATPAPILVYVNVSTKIYHSVACKRFSPSLVETNLEDAKKICRPCQLCKPGS